jgi:hypothetical protein
MFYSTASGCSRKGTSGGLPLAGGLQDILTRRKGGLAVVWLAATLGPRSSLKRLTKKDVVACDIVKACEKITVPDEPMALRYSKLPVSCPLDPVALRRADQRRCRLSACLMVGVARIHGQQVSSKCSRAAMCAPS